MVLNAEHCYNFEEITVGLMKQTIIVGFSGILDTGQVEDHKITKDKLIDGKKL